MSKTTAFHKSSLSEVDLPQNPDQLVLKVLRPIKPLPVHRYI